MSGTSHKNVLAGNIDDTGRMRMLSYRGVMLLSLAATADETGRKEAMHQLFCESARLYFQQLDKLSHLGESAQEPPVSLNAKEFLLENSQSQYNLLKGFYEKTSTLFKCVIDHQGIEQVEMLDLADLANNSIIPSLNVIINILKDDLEKLYQEDSKKIKSAVSSVNSVASSISTLNGRLKTLSFNARIESAAAGESGRSFHVIAKEVKDISDQFKLYTNEITNKSIVIRQSS